MTSYDAYYQPRLTTRNVGESWKEYEKISYLMKTEYDADIVYIEFLRLISVVLPADEEAALWAIKDKAQKITKLFKLIHGTFGNDKNRATEIFNVVQNHVTKIRMKN